MVGFGWGCCIELASVAMDAVDDFKSDAREIERWTGCGFGGRFRLLFYEEMSDTHLLEVMGMLERNGRRRA